MATSGTYAIDYDIAEFVDESFERCGIDPATLTARHTRSARRSLNLMFADWANEGVLLFAVDEQTQTLTSALVSYSVPTGTLAILEGVLRRDGIDTPVHRISREMYHLIPNKTNGGLPTQLYLDRKAGTYYLWNAPDNSTDVLRYWRLRRIQDVTAAAETADVPYRWFEALAAGLAEKLAVKFAPDRLSVLAGLSAKAYQRAKTEDRERGDLKFGVGW